MEKPSFKLQVFEGPLDLLLHLISKNKVNIYDIPIAQILEQYMAYIDSMNDMNMEVTADFLAMASQLIYIKSKMLLPKYEDEEEEDPRDLLVRMLLEYKRYKEVSGTMKEMSAPLNSTFVKEPEKIAPDNTYSNSHSPDELYDAYLNAVRKVKRRLPPPVTSFKGIVGHTVYSVSRKAISLLRQLLFKKKIPFLSLFESSKSRSEIVATFLAILELAKNRRISVDNDEMRLAEKVKNS